MKETYLLTLLKIGSYLIKESAGRRSRAPIAAPQARSRMPQRTMPSMGRATVPMSRGRMPQQGIPSPYAGRSRGFTNIVNNTTNNINRGQSRSSFQPQNASSFPAFRSRAGRFGSYSQPTSSITPLSNDTLNTGNMNLLSSGLGSLDYKPKKPATPTAPNEPTQSLDDVSNLTNKADTYDEASPQDNSSKPIIEADNSSKPIIKPNINPYGDSSPVNFSDSDPRWNKPNINPYGDSSPVNFSDSDPHSPESEELRMEDARRIERENINPYGDSSPASSKPGVNEPGLGKPGKGMGGVAKPSVPPPIFNNPNVRVPPPIFNKPGVSKPGFNEPGVNKPGVNKPGVENIEGEKKRSGFDEGYGGNYLSSTDSQGFLTYPINSKNLYTNKLFGSQPYPLTAEDTKRRQEAWDDYKAERMGTGNVKRQAPPVGYKPGLGKQSSVREPVLLKLLRIGSLLSKS